VLTRRRLLQAGAGAMVASYAPVLNRAVALGARTPDSLPDPTRAAGEPTSALPFDHLVIVMMENHSFDNYLGMLPRRGQPAADGFDFDAAGNPVNSNPYKNGFVTVQHAGSHCQPGHITQNWRSTHLEMNGGRMDGFANVSTDQMVYWDESDLPFYYSLAKTFCVGDRWFCSAPCQTYPNRRFLLAATAFGLISTDTSKVFQDPPNGTIVDRLDAHGVTWRDYFTDVPATGVIASIPEKHPANLAHVDQFYVDCAAGTLPQVSFVDSDIGLAARSPATRPARRARARRTRRTYRWARTSLRVPPIPCSARRCGRGS
jgi:phospholipase C